jgi:hypothetical protein
VVRVTHDNALREAAGEAGERARLLTLDEYAAAPADGDLLDL